MRRENPNKSPKKTPFELHLTDDKTTRIVFLVNWKSERFRPRFERIDDKTVLICDAVSIITLDAESSSDYSIFFNWRFIKGKGMEFWSDVPISW